MGTGSVGSGSGPAASSPRARAPAGPDDAPRQASLETAPRRAWPVGSRFEGNAFAHWLVYRALAWLMVTTLASLYYVIPLTTFFVLPFALWQAPALAFTVLALFAASLLWPSGNWPLFRKVFQVTFEIFNVRSNVCDVRDMVDKKRKYILAMVSPARHRIPTRPNLPSPPPLHLSL